MPPLGFPTAMAPAPPAPPPAGMVSVVVTVRNEGRNLAPLLESLLLQEAPFEVLVVDSNSEDDTLAIARAYEARHPGVVRVLEHGGTRGESRNFGVQQARGEHVAFIDGDCVATPGWLAALRTALQRVEIASGETQQVGWSPFETLARVELKHKGYDVTAPSCNLAYRRAVFEEVGGFDAWFRTAEDIDLNYRAVDRGHTLAHVPEALVFHKTRSTIFGFLKQAFWNGYGRKQLTLKHGRLWERYKLGTLLATQLQFWALVRLGAALWGYILAKLREPRDRFGPPRSAAAPQGVRGAPARRP